MEEVRAALSLPCTRVWGNGKVGLTILRLLLFDPEDRQKRGWGGAWEFGFWLQRLLPDKRPFMASLWLSPSGSRALRDSHVWCHRESWGHSLPALPAPACVTKHWVLEPYCQLSILGLATGYCAGSAQEPCWPSQMETVLQQFLVPRVQPCYRGRTGRGHFCPCLSHETKDRGAWWSCQHTRLTLRHRDSSLLGLQCCPLML